MRYGTRAFSGLKTQVAEHLLEDGDLLQADNVNFDKIGAVKAETEDTEITTTISSPNGLGYVYMNGGGHYFYKDTTVYDETYVRRYDVEAGSASTLGYTVEWPDADGQLFVTQGNGEAILTDGATPYVHHDASDKTRKLGALVGTDNLVLPVEPGVRVLANATSGSITDVSESGGTVTVTSAGHPLSAGDVIYIDDCDNCLDINGAVYTVATTTTNTFTLDGVNGSNWSGTGAQGAGTWYENASGKAGDYQYWVSYVLTIDGRDGVIESSLAPLPFVDGKLTGTIALTQTVRVYVNAVQASDLYAYFHRADGLVDAAVTANEIQVAVRIYRTRAGGTTPYLIKEFSHDGSGATDRAYEPTNGYLVFTDTITDANTGAAWLEETVDAHDPPPSCSLFEMSRGRAYCVDADNPQNLHFSLIGNYDYWPPAYYITMPEEIKCIRSAGDYLVVFSATRMWLYYHDDLLGTLKEIPVQQGVTAQTAAISLAGSVAFENEMGMGSVVFANDQGLWVVGPGGVQELTQAVRDDWIASAGGTWSGCVLGDKMMWTCDKGAGSSDKAWIFKSAGGGLTIGRTSQPSTQDYEILVADPENNVIVTQQSDGIYTFGTDSTEKTMQLQSRWYGDGSPGTLVRIVLDMSGSATGSVSALTNRKAIPSSNTATNSNNQRALVHVQFDSELGDFWRIGYSGTGTIYGWWIEVNQAPNVY